MKAMIYAGVVVGLGLGLIPPTAFNARGILTGFLVCAIAMLGFSIAGVTRHRTRIRRVHRDISSPDDQRLSDVYVYYTPRANQQELPYWPDIPATTHGLQPFTDHQLFLGHTGVQTYSGAIREQGEYAGTVATRTQYAKLTVYDVSTCSPDFRTIDASMWWTA